MQILLVQQIQAIERIDFIVAILWGDFVVCPLFLNSYKKQKKLSSNRSSIQLKTERR